MDAERGQKRGGTRVGTRPVREMVRETDDATIIPVEAYTTGTRWYATSQPKLMLTKTEARKGGVSDNREYNAPERVPRVPRWPPPWLTASPEPEPPKVDANRPDPDAWPSLAGFLEACLAGGPVERLGLARAIVALGFDLDAAPSALADLRALRYADADVDGVSWWATPEHIPPAVVALDPTDPLAANL